MTTLLAGAAMVSSPAMAEDVTVPCTTVKIIQKDGVKTLTSIPHINFREAIGDIIIGTYKGKTLTFILLGNGNIECQLHETYSGDSE